MKLNVLFLSAGLAFLPLSSFAKSGPHKGETQVHVSNDPVERAKKDMLDAEAACGRANNSLGSKRDSAGIQDSKEIHDLGRNKDSACNAAMGAQTAYLNVLSGAIKNQKGVVAEKQKEFDKLSKDPKASKDAVKAAQAELKAEEKKLTMLDQEYGKYSTNHNINAKKH